MDKGILQRENIGGSSPSIEKKRMRHPGMTSSTAGINNLVPPVRELTNYLFFQHQD